MRAFVDPERFKNAKSIKKKTNKDIAERLQISKATVDDITRKKSFDSVYLEELCRYLNVSPEYLNKTYNTKAEAYIADCFKLSVEEYLEKYPNSKPEFYTMYHAYYAGRIDSEDILIPSYFDKRLKELEANNYDSFICWLKTINDSESLDDVELFPTDAELERILASMTKIDVLEFQTFVVRSAVDYLIGNHYYFGSEEDEFDRYLSKINDRRKKIQKEGK